MGGNFHVIHAKTSDPPSSVNFWNSTFLHLLSYLLSTLSSSILDVVPLGPPAPPELTKSSSDFVLSPFSSGSCRSRVHITQNANKRLWQHRFPGRDEPTLPKLPQSSWVQPWELQLYSMHVPCGQCLGEREEHAQSSQ